MPEQIFLTFLGLIILGFLFELGLGVFLIHNLFLIWRRTYQLKVNSKIPLFGISASKTLSFFYLPVIMIRLGIGFHIFQKAKYEAKFNKLINYEEIRKTKNQQLINLVDKHRRLHRIYALIFNIYILAIIFLMIVGAIFGLLFHKY